MPFDSDRKLMSTLHCLKDGYTMIVKGATDVILDRLAGIQREDGVVPVEESVLEEIRSQNEAYSRQGLRVLAVAYRKFDGERALTVDNENELIFVGMIAMMDPPSVESAAAVPEITR